MESIPFSKFKMEKLLTLFNMKEEIKLIGARLKQKRQSENLSVVALSAKLGIGKEKIYKWEKGTRPSDPEDYKILETYLTDTPEYIAKRDLTIKETKAFLESYTVDPEKADFNKNLGLLLQNSINQQRYFIDLLTEEMSKNETLRKENEFLKQRLKEVRDRGAKKEHLAP
jgi:transcriptional regulator with XRE-family HTH domain